MRLRLVGKYVAMRLFFWLTLRRWLPQRARWWAFRQGISRHVYFVRQKPPATQWNNAAFQHLAPGEPVEIVVELAMPSIREAIRMIRDAERRERSGDLWR